MEVSAGTLSTRLSSPSLAAGSPFLLHGAMGSETSAFFGGGFGFGTVFFTSSGVSMELPRRLLPRRLLPRGCSPRGLRVFVIAPCPR
jgi:hypothetical protein